MPKTPSSPAALKSLQTAFLSQIQLEPALLEAFEELLDAHCFLKDRKGRTLFMSPLWARHHGFRSPDEALLKTDSDLTPGTLASQYLADDQSVLRTGSPILGRLEICIDEVGLPDWHLTSKFPLRDRSRKIIGILGITRACRGQAPPDSPNARITPATRLLREQLQIFPSLKTLASACHLSVRHLQRAFQQTLGIAPRTYWMKCRIQAACDALRSSRESLSELALRLGFCDQSNFSAHFKKHTGQSPLAFRRSFAIARSAGNSFLPP
jgi:AraC-like DNA-binding protein